MPGAVAAVVLCGGFGDDVVKAWKSQPQATGSSSSRPTTTTSGLRQPIVSGPAGQEQVVPALVQLNGKKAVEYVVRALEGCRRLQPLAEHVTFVVNESDRTTFLALFSEWSDLGLTSDNLVSNGATSPSEWAGEVPDLKRALAKIGTGWQAVMAIGGELTFLPGYNLQRVLEHSIIRNKDTVAFSPLTEVDDALLAPSLGPNDTPSLVAPSDTVPLPPLATIRSGVGRSELGPGSLALQPLAVLRGGSLGAVQESVHRHLTGLAKALLDNTGLCGVELTFGHFNLRSPQAIDYADRYMAYFVQHIKPQAPAEEEEGAEPVAPGTMNFRYSTAFTANLPKLMDVTSEFDRMYFGSLGGTTGGSKYKLPSTFYMTAYRRQAADLM